MKKKITLTFTIIVAVIISGYVAVHFIIKNKVSSLINENIGESLLTYSAYDYNLFEGTFEMDSINYNFNDNSAFLKSIKINHIDYLNLIFQNKINIGKVLINHPKIKINNPSKLFPVKNKDSKKGMNKSIKVSNIAVQQGNISIYSDTLLQFQLKNFDIDLNQFKITPESRKKKLPFTYKSYSIKGNDIFYHVDQLHSIKTKSFTIKTNNAVFNEFRLVPNYSRKDYVKVIPYEKDLLEVDLNKIKVKDYQLKFDSEMVFFITKKIELNDTKMSVYRDKSPKPDPTQKDLYSKVIRDLPFKIKIDSLLVQKMDLDYMQKNINHTNAKAKISFNKMNATISDLTNIDMKSKDFPTTKINISCLFMEDAPLDVYWNFKINSKKDVFTLKGEGTKIPSTAANPFLRPAENMELSGPPIHKLYFNFKGDNNQANGEYRMVYDQLKVKLYKTNTQKEKKVLGFLANLFIKNENNMKSNKTVLEKVERDKTKAFWNYFWRCIKAGLRKSLIKVNN